MTYLLPFLIVCAIIVGSCLTLVTLDPRKRLPTSPMIVTQYDPVQQTYILVLPAALLDEQALRMEAWIAQIEVEMNHIHTGE